MKQLNQLLLVSGALLLFSACGDRPVEPGDCSNNADCAANQYCKKDSCSASNGTCEATPQQCATIYAPVCGCDGKTYGNSCVAAAAGANIAHTGECGGGGGNCNAHGDCAPGEFCKTSQICLDDTTLPGAADAERQAAPGALPDPQHPVTYAGSCEPKPAGCTREYAPVCGCDGNTYGNACEADAAGVNYASVGECEKCAGDADCDSDEYCKFPSCETTFFVPFPNGTCEHRPTDCTQQYAPVCGCDNQTYGNACSAASAGMTIKHGGECGSGCEDLKAQYQAALADAQACNPFLANAASQCTATVEGGLGCALCPVPVNPANQAAITLLDQLRLQYDTSNCDPGICPLIDCAAPLGTTCLATGGTPPGLCAYQ